PPAPSLPPPRAERSEAPDHAVRRRACRMPGALYSAAMTAPLNILVIQTDAQHHQWLGFRGTTPVRTPHLDRLARERAVVFDRAYSCSGVCVPSRTSLMTGRYTIGHGVVNNHTTPRPDREPWLGRLLRDAGYRTGYFGKTHFAGNDHDMPGEGWDESFLPHDYLQYLRDHHV